MASTQRKSWCFTIPNYSQDDVERIRNLASECSTLVVGEEIGNGGLPHLQGVAVFRTARSMRAVRQALGGPYHCEPTRDLAASKEYCRKDGKLLVDVDGRDHSGHRTDLDTLHEALDIGGLPEAKRVCPTLLIKYGAGCKIYMGVGGAEPRTKPKVYVFCSPFSGIGKSYTAIQATPNYVFRCLKGNTPWFDGYNGEKHIILEEFDKAPLPYSFALSLLDYGPIMLPTKGGFTPCRATVFTITCNYDDFYATERDTRPWLRRMDEFAEIHTQNPFPLPILQ